MKRFWLVLLALGMLFAFSSSVFAADVKFTGSYYATGMYLNDTTLRKDATGFPSTAFYYQRLRVNMEFFATPALKLVSRFDALERIWGGARSTTTLGPTGQPVWDVDSYGTRAENQNIAFDYAYIWYASKIGLWQVGISSDNVWGPAFGNNDEPEGQIHYTLVKMPIIVGGKIVKIMDNSRSALSAPWGAQNDVDADKYVLYGIYNFKGGSVGLLGYYARSAATRPAAFGNYLQTVYGVIPYVRAKVGPVALEAEVQWQGGKARDWEAAGADVKIDSWSAYVDALADMGMFYAGGTVAWVSGDKPGSATKMEGTQSGGRDWNPMLIMFNHDLTYWVNGLPGYSTTNIAGPMTNAWFLSARGGVRPVADLTIGAAVAYAWADQKPGSAFKKDYGIELDVTATYRITNNLTYMLGGAYLWTGDYFKAGVASNKVADNYMLINKLTLTF